MTLTAEELDVLLFLGSYNEKTGKSKRVVRIMTALQERGLIDGFPGIAWLTEAGRAALLATNAGDENH